MKKFIVKLQEMYLFSVNYMLVSVAEGINGSQTYLLTEWMEINSLVRIQIYIFLFINIKIIKNRSLFDHSSQHKYIYIYYLYDAFSFLITVIIIL